MVGADLRQGTLVPLLRQFQPAPEGAFYLVYLTNRTQPSRMRVLVDFLIARFGRRQRRGGQRWGGGLGQRKASRPRRGHSSRTAVSNDQVRRISITS
jgi:hypothetical protein